MFPCTQLPKRLQCLFRGRGCAIDFLTEVVDQFPTFQPHSLLRNRHLQTVVGNVFRGEQQPYQAECHTIALPDGDMAMLHDDCPAGWNPTAPSALLVHGLAGCYQSPYVACAARRLNQAGVRTFRMDMRACGAAEGFSSMPYHAGCSEDLRLALERVVEICPASAISLIGFSIGGNIVLKLAGESADTLPLQLGRLIAVCPPIDLAVCVERFSKVAGGFYDRHFVRAHYRQLNRSAALVDQAPHVIGGQRPRGQHDF